MHAGSTSGARAAGSPAGTARVRYVGRHLTEFEVKTAMLALSPRFRFLATDKGKG